MRPRLSALFALVPLLLLHVAPAQAAPQILAALEAPEGMPFHCTLGQCETDITTFCLQQDRDTPRRGTAYKPAAADHFALRLTATDGSTREISAAGLEYAAGHGFTSVRVSLPEAKLKQFGAVSARLVVGRQASLVPVPQAGDPDPISKAEETYVTESLRPLGEEMIDLQPLATSARIVGRIAAAITDYRASPGGGNMDRLWDGVLDDMTPALGQDGKDAGPAIDRARKEINKCMIPGFHHSMAGVKTCLEYRHGDLMRDLNVDYWNQQPGS